MTSAGPTDRSNGVAGVAPALRWGGVTDVGGVRQLNEDAWYGSSSVCVVADGMGGHAAGEVASGLVIDAVSDAFAIGPRSLADLPGMVLSLNSAVLDRADADGTAGMGTTVVGVAVARNGVEPAVVIFHVGDSRCYRLLDGVLMQVTTDHSYVQELISAGRLAAADARSHPLRNVITRALGADDGVDADFHVLDSVDCRLLLCSDGLNGELDDAEIGRLLASGVPAEAASRLVDAAVAGGARDNVTAVVVDVVVSRHTSTAEITAPPTQVADVTADPIAPSGEVRASDDSDGSPWSPPVPTDTGPNPPPGGST